MKFFLIVLYLNCFHYILNSRFIETKHHFDEENFSPIGKFLSKSGKIKIRLLFDISYDYRNPTITKNIQHLPIKFIFIDYDVYISIKNLNLDKITKCYKFIQNAIFIKFIDITFHKQNRIILDEEKDNQNLSTIWYFLLLDCDFHTHKMIEDFPFLMTDLTVLDEEGSHFSYEEKYLSTYFTSILFSYILFFAFYLKNFFAEIKKEDLNLHIILCWISTLSIFIYILLQSIHLYIYSIDGIGLYLLDIISLFFWSFSQFIISSLIIFTIAGWGIFYQSLTDYDNLYPTLILSFLVQSVLFVLFHYNEESFEKFHDFDGYVGYLIMVSKMILLILLVYLINEIINKINNFYGENVKLKNFYLSLGIIGILYIMSFPFLYYYVLFIDYIYRHKIIVGGDILIQIMCLYALMKQFTSKHNAFGEYAMYSSPLPKIYKSQVKPKKLLNDH